jgi:XRE family transcriptional regulator of biofilm formation
MVGELVKNYRVKRGLSLSKLAERAGVDKSYLHSIERNVDPIPSIQFLEKIAPILGIAIDTLLAECSDQTFDPVWNDIVTKVLERGLTTEEYIDFLEFTNIQSSETTELQLPINHHLKTFLESQKLEHENGIN